jgi:hypothetical protein
MTASQNGSQMNEVKPLGDEPHDDEPDDIGQEDDDPDDVDEFADDELSDSLPHG